MRWMQIGLLFMLLFFSFLNTYCQQNKPIQISFRPVFGKADIDMENALLKGGDTTAFEIIRFYISNLKLMKDNKVVYSEKNSVHLVDAADSNSLQILLQVPAKMACNKLQFNIGIDSTTNVSGALGGDLDPTKGMYWTWQSGYINVKVEGRNPICSSPGHAFQFHLGGYQNPYNSLQKVGVELRKKRTVILLDIKRFMQHIDLSKQHHLMSPGEEAVRLSGIFAKCFRTK